MSVILTMQMFDREWLTFFLIASQLHAGSSEVEKALVSQVKRAFIISL